VLVVAENCAAQVALLFAAGELDAWPVLVSARLAPAEIERILEHCRPRLAMFLSSRSSNALERAREFAAAELDVEPLGRVHCLRARAEPARESIDPRVEQRVAAMIYTSGSTGVPKGAMLSHGNLLYMGLTQARARRYVPQDKIYCVVPVAHVGGLCSVLMGTLAGFGCVSLYQRFSPDELGRALREDDVTILAGVPTLFAKFLAWVRANPQAFGAPRLRLVTSASSPLDPALKRDVESLFGVPLMNGYGMTESAAVVCQTALNDRRTDVSAGRPFPGQEVRFVNEQGVDVPQGEVGEIWVRGPNVFLGYYHNPDATAATLTPGGWLRTGDLGYCDAGGDVFIAGRIKDTIKRSGYNVYPVDVETALNACPGVRISAVVGRPNGVDEEVIAFVQLQEAGPSPDRILEFLRERLAPYKLPNALRIVPQLPTLHNGKVDRAECRRMALASA
jgi:acyl-CoA synthetase (AMP-forming)/AMP-acid ligase II